MRQFWDIESYINLFCCGFIDDADHLEMHYMVNSEEDRADVLRACKDSGYTFTAYDLKDDASVLLKHFKTVIPSDGKPSLLSNFLGTPDKEIKAKEDTYFAYNMLSYDIQMIDYLKRSVLGNRVQTTTESLRHYSDTLIADTARRISTKTYERYGGQVDVAFLNETQIDKGRPKIGLKTLVGIKGGSIIESESNKSGYSESIYDDILYNINDISEMKDVVFPGKMENTLKIRQNLIAMYPKLSENGVTPNSTSAKFVEFIIAPDAPIEDIPVVSYMYPAKHVAERLGVPQTDILEDTKDWYIENVYKEVLKHNPKAAKNHLAKFMSIYEFYASFRGKNWNESQRHFLQHGIPAHTKADRRALMAQYGTYIPMIDKYGNDSYTYENFSYGGIHGDAIYKEQLDIDRARIRELKEKYGYISKIPASEKVPAALMNLIKVQSRTQFNDFPKHLSHEIPAFFKATKMVDEIVDPEDFTPFIYTRKTDKGVVRESEGLIKRYSYTSAGFSVHQDFAGYYPMLLINMGAFYDGHGKDNYEEVYNLRIGIKNKLKTLKFGSPEWIETNIIQEGYKLILNSASGSLDAAFDTNIRANNKAMAMRIIGQLFTWRIGQALALEGATIPSSNTDGIYVFDIDIDLNKKIVDAELEKLYVKIDPEPVFLVSKDTNNRMEMEYEGIDENGDMVDFKVTSAKGASLTSWGGAQVDKNLTHPALVDRVLTYYLQNKNVLNGPVNLDLVKKGLDQYYAETDKRTFVYMASWVLRSTSGSIFIDDRDTVYPGTIRGWLSTDGVRLTKYGTRSSQVSNTFKGFATMLFPDTRIGDPEMIEYLSSLGILDKYFSKALTVKEFHRLTDDQRFYAVAKSKISGLRENSRLYINNASILKMTDEEIDQIYNSLNLEEYVYMIADFAKAWHNTLAAA